MVLRKVDKRMQYIISIAFVVLVAGICYGLSSVLGYKVIGYILLICVSLVAMVFDIRPVVLAAVLSALIWDFFFIPPYFTLHIGSTEDSVLLLMYFIVAMIHTVLTNRVRKMEKAAIYREEKERTLKLYSTMLNSLSHELRTPIATIVAGTDNLLSADSRLTNEDKQEVTKEIAKAALRLDQQVGNLLNMSRLESGFVRLRRDWCDVNDLVYSIVARVEENFVTQKINILISPDLPLFKTDKGILEQVLYNLLHNAVLYTPPGTQIHIQATAKNDGLEIIVADNGNGFPEDEIQDVFNKFYRLKNTRTGGTGLGLSIVKGFIEALGGSIVLENIPAGGARFTIAIPAEISSLKDMSNE